MLITDGAGVPRPTLRPACPYQWESALAKLLRWLRGEPSRLPSRGQLDAHRAAAHQAGAFARVSELGRIRQP